MIAQVGNEAARGYDEKEIDAAKALLQQRTEIAADIDDSPFQTGVL